MNMVTGPLWNKPLQTKYQRPSVVTQATALACRRLRCTDHGFDTSVGCMASSRLALDTQGELSQKIKLIKVISALKYLVNMVVIETYTNKKDGI